MAIKISYIMPCFNCENTVEESINSILNNNIECDEEIICVDDCSIDRTYEILKAKSEKDNRIRIIKHDQNKGGGAARNTAVKAATHEWIFCVDSDNLLEKNSVSRLKNLVETNKSKGAFFHKAVLFEKDINKPIGERYYHESKNPFEGYVTRWDIPGASGNYLFSKGIWEKVSGYPEDGGALDTTGFGLRVAAEGIRLECDKRGYYYHRTGHDSYWQRFRKGDVSCVMYQLLRPHFDLIAKEDVEYIEQNKSSFYGKLSERPIKLKREFLKQLKSLISCKS